MENGCRDKTKRLSAWNEKEEGSEEGQRGGWRSADSAERQEGGGTSQVFWKRPSVFLGKFRGNEG